MFRRFVVLAALLSKVASAQTSIPSEQVWIFCDLLGGSADGAPRYFVGPVFSVDVGARTPWGRSGDDPLWDAFQEGLKPHGSDGSVSSGSCRDFPNRQMAEARRQYERQLRQISGVAIVDVNGPAPAPSEAKKGGRAASDVAASGKRRDQATQQEVGPTEGSFVGSGKRRQRTSEKPEPTEAGEGAKRRGRTSEKQTEPTEGGPCYGRDGKSFDPGPGGGCPVF